jgi:hypothetical protein
MKMEKTKKDGYFVRLLRMYSAAFVLSGNGFEGTSLTSFTTLAAILSDLFMEVIPSTLWLV